RQNYSSTLPENIAKKDAEAIEILSLRQKIANNEWYQNLIPEYKKKVDKNNPPARLVGWEDIIKSSRIKEQYFVSPWKWYSNYAHSEFIGTMQLGNYLLDGMEMKKIMYHNMEFNTMILCAAIIELLNLFPELIDSYEQSVSMKDRTYICYWSRGTLKKGLN
ncbi:hypothetical protein, partial [Chitinophaga sp.]|uniref:hypothetical protein n=1 Tax=Chitinophaga sp. TaxID=1869181 RepID=UPI002F92F55F